MLIESLIAAICVAGPYHDACAKAIEASSKQIGIYQGVEKVETETQKRTLKTVASFTGETPLMVVGAAAKVYREKAIVYTIRPKSFVPIDSITTKVGAQNGGNGSINFEWRF